MKRVLVLCLALAMASAGCGKSEAEKQQEAAAKQAEEAAKSTEQTAQQAAKGLEAMAKGLGAMAGVSTGDMKPVEPVSFREFMALFPDLDGWEKAKPTGERMSSPVSFSTAEVRYKKDDASIEIKIMDSGYNALLLTPYAMFLSAGYEKETADGYEKSTKVGGEPGWEKWNASSKNGELNALVGKRFLLTIEGRGIDDAKALHDVASRVDMAKLAALK